jgi:hypothetical protein
MLVRVVLLLCPVLTLAQGAILVHETSDAEALLALSVDTQASKKRAVDENLDLQQAGSARLKSPRAPPTLMQQVAKAEDAADLELLLSLDARVPVVALPSSLDESAATTSLFGSLR